MKYFLKIFLCIITSISFAQTKEDRIHIMSFDNIDCFYKYDHLGRRIEMKRTDSKYTENYVYIGDTILKFNKFFNDSSLQEIFLLNQDGLVEVWCELFKDDVVFTEYKYDHKKQLAFQRVDKNNTQSVLKVEMKNGNIVKEIQYDTILVDKKFRCISTVITHTFSDKLNMMNHVNFGRSYYANMNKNLKAKTIYEISSSDECDHLPCPINPANSSKEEFVFDYTFDEKNRMIQQIETNTHSNEKSIIKYFYN